MTSVRFIDFWKDFDPKENLFLQILDNELGKIDVEQGNRNFVDFEFHSVFLGRRAQISKKISSLVRQSVNSEPALANVSQSSAKISKEKSKRQIWYTGENVRPPLSAGYDGYLSFDQDSYGGRNAYLPLWWLRLNWYEEFKFSPQLGTKIEMQTLLKPRQLDAKKSKFACAFIGNPHPLRIHFIEELSKLGNVDVYGSHVGKPVTNKYDIAKDYKYSVCFENDLFPGYVTEKLVDSYAIDNIPIYWGNLGNDNNINRSAFLNLSDFNSVSDFIDCVSDIDYENKYNQAFLNSPPNLSEVIQIICAEFQTNRKSS